ncbi:RDD family protein [Streptomyces sp. WM6378]|uniref:RDD family protein n=1 Tax=Streptomyces sp. WM6378 TaxID=1415557 RepID=UPI0006AE9291|nr:RDD family protein [Streptomyces sp. WM6378]
MDNASAPDLLPPQNRIAVARRAAAWSIDFALVLVAAYAVGVHTVHRITGAWDNAPELGLSGWQIITGDGSAIGKAGHVATALWHQVVTAVIQGFFVLACTTFLYHWSTLALAGRTLGKAVVGLRITPRTPARAAARALVTTIADVGCFSFACCLLVSGHLVWSVFAWLGAVAFFWFNALAVYTGRTVADRVAGTTVVAAVLAARPPAYGATGPVTRPARFTAAVPPMPRYEPESSRTP